MEGFEEIIKHRQAVVDNIQKAFGATPEEGGIEKAVLDDFLEKGKWNIGDEKVYQGVTYFVGGFNAKGTPLWKKKDSKRASKDVDFVEKKDNTGRSYLEGKIGGNVVRIQKDGTLKDGRPAYTMSVNDKIVEDEGYTVTFTSPEKAIAAYKEALNVNKNVNKTAKQPAPKKDDKSADNLNVSFTLNQSAYDAQYEQAKKVDKFSREFGKNSLATLLNSAKKGLEEIKKNNLGTKSSIAKNEEKINELASKIKAIEDADKHLAEHPEERDFDAELRLLKEFRDIYKKQRDSEFDQYITLDAVAKRTGDSADEKTAETARKRWKQSFDLHEKFQNEINDTLEAKKKVEDAKKAASTKQAQAAPKKDDKQPKVSALSTKIMSKIKPVIGGVNYDREEKGLQDFISKNEGIVKKIISTKFEKVGSADQYSPTRSGAIKVKLNDKDEIVFWTFKKYDVKTGIKKTTYETQIIVDGKTRGNSHQGEFLASSTAGGYSRKPESEAKEECLLNTLYEYYKMRK